MKPHDVIVVGGGVIGLTTAYFLAKEGASVLLCDQGKVGMESSWAGAGIIPPSNPDHAQLPLDRLRALSSANFPALSKELQERTGIDNGYVRCGGLEFGIEHAAMPADEWYGLGVTINRLSEKDVARMEPNIAANVGTALEIPEMAQLRNPHHVRALKAACLSTGRFALREDVPVSSLHCQANRVQGIRVGDEILSGGAVLVAAGAWTDRLLQPLGVHLKIEPVRGQIALLNPGAMLFRHILISGAQYLVPRLDGRVLIGSTEEHVGFDKATTAEAIDGLLALGVRLVPRLAGAALERTWAGLRPGSPDGLPFLGPVPGVTGLCVAAGHFRAGIQLSIGTAILLKEMLLGQQPTMPADAFRLAR